MKFYIKQKVFTVRNRFDILNLAGEKVYSVEGKFFSLHNRLELLDNSGVPVLHAFRKLLTFLPFYTIENNRGEQLATIKKQFSLKPNFSITYGYQSYQVNGNFFAHSFEITDGNKTIAYITKKYISFGDSYEIDVIDDQDTSLWLFIVIVIDQVIHENKSSSSINM